MAFERQFAFTVDAGPRVAMQLTFGDAGTVDVTVNVADSEKHSAAISWQIDADKKTLQYTVGTQLGPKAACLATCLGISIGKPLLECLLKSKTLAEIEACLKEKGLGGLSEAAVCIAACLALA